jgi:hypothetical protein
MHGMGAIQIEYLRSAGDKKINEQNREAFQHALSVANTSS